MEIDFIYIVSIAFILDTIFGDPRSLPHLIVGYGNSISFFEKKFNIGNYKFIKGAIVALILVGVTFLVPYTIIRFLYDYNYRIIAITLSITMLFYCIANRTLIKEGYAVFNALHKDGLIAGRKRLSWIVGRETDKLNAQQIRIATFETMSENLSDGVIAPLFYFLILGIPGVMTYKMINTLDSMVGYKNERYLQFGKFAAKLDDVVNYIPARITAILILVVELKYKGLMFLVQEGKKHSSPNAGYPEAALAYVLNCQFGGPNYYHGKLVEKPFIGYHKREIKHKEISKVSNINFKVTIVFITISIIWFRCNS